MLKNALKSGFPAVLYLLAEIAFQGDGKKLFFGTNFSHRVNIGNDEKLLDLCGVPYTINTFEQYKTVFKLENIRDLIVKRGIPLIYKDVQIAMDQDSLTILIQEVAEMKAIKEVVDAYSNVPLAYRHDKANTDPEYQKNWRGLWKKDGLLSTTSYWLQSQYISGEMNITEAIKRLPRAEDIQKVDIDDTKVVFTLKGPGQQSHVVFFPEPVPGNDRTKNYSRTRPQLVDNK